MEGNARARQCACLAIRSGPSHLPDVPAYFKSPMTSAPFGGAKRNRSGANFGFRSTLVKRTKLFWPKASTISSAAKPFASKPIRISVNAAVQSVLRRQITPRERLLDVLVAGQKSRRRAAQRIADLAHDDLVQVLVEDPDPLAITDQQLLVGLLDDPAEFAGPR